MLRPDLERAGIPYVDAVGLVFDIHALRCQCEDFWLIKLA